MGLRDNNKESVYDEPMTQCEEKETRHYDEQLDVEAKNFIHHLTGKYENYYDVNEVLKLSVKFLQDTRAEEVERAEEKLKHLHEIKDSL